MKLNDRPLTPIAMPHDVELEQTILKACMLGGDDFNPVRLQILKALTPDDFYLRANQEYFKSIANIDAKGQLPNLESIWKDIKTRKSERYAKQSELISIYQNAEIIIDETHSVNKLKDLSAKRNQITIFNAAVKKCENGKFSAEDIRKFAMDHLSDNGQGPDNESFYDHIEMCLGKEIIKMEFPELQWIIQDILTEGVTLFAGKPKAGKSVLALNICVAVATGGKCLDRDIVQGRVLYLHLEDNQRRIQKRLKAMMPVDDYTGEMSSGLDGLYLAVRWPRMGGGGLRALDEYCREHKPRLVVIDTFKAFQSEAASTKLLKQQYDLDYDEFIKLRPIAEKHSTGILVVGHARKAHSEDPIDLISGTFGKAGAVDNCIVLTERNGNRAKIYNFGRDVDNLQFTLEYTKSTWTWSLLGNPDEIKLMESQREVLDFLKRESSKEEPATFREIREITGVELSNLRNRILPKLIDDGYAKRPKKGYYYAV